MFTLPYLTSCVTNSCCSMVSSAEKVETSSVLSLYCVHYLFFCSNLVGPSTSDSRLPLSPPFPFPDWASGTLRPRVVPGAPNLHFKHCLTVPFSVSKFKYLLLVDSRSASWGPTTHWGQGCIKCKLALRGLAAYLLNGLRWSSNAAVYKADVNKDGGR